MTFKHPYHQKIDLVLRSLNNDLFKRAGAYFGGGTHLTLKYGEYRWSKDIDFVCPSGPGYRMFRTEIDEDGYDAIFIKSEDIILPRPMTADQYGIRFPVKVGEVIIKFEIFNEARILLGEPEYADWTKLPCLNLIDSFAEKLLANADRWADSAIESRDLIDLCVLRNNNNIPEESITKAETAYPVKKPLISSIQHFQDNPDYRQRCFASLEVADPKFIIDGLDLLANDFELKKTKRKNDEAKPEDLVH